MEEADSEYDSIMPCELELKIPTTVCLEYFFSQIKDKDVFRQRLEVFRHFPFTLIRETCLEFLLFLHETNILFRIVDNYLVQFWVPVTIGDKRYLITSDQPFHLKEPVHGVCSSRKRCMDYLIPIDDDISTEEEGLLGPPRRAFRNGRAEVSLDFSNYTCTKYPPRSKAVGSAIGCFKALPMQSGRTALKPTQPESWIVVKLVVSYKHILWGVCKRLFEKPEVSLGLPTLVPEIEDLLRAVCTTHQLPLAQTWVSFKYKNEAVWYKFGASYAVNDDFGSDDEEGSCIVDVDFRDFIQACQSSCIKKGRGVVGKALSSGGACFCKDISQLSMSEYSLVCRARQAGLTGCFAISLTHHIWWEDYVYTVEFFLSNIQTQSGDPRNFIKMLLTTMKEHFRAFRVASGQELGENLLVEVIKTSPTDDLDSFEICDLTGFDNTLSYSDTFLGGKTTLYLLILHGFKQTQRSF